MAAKLDWLLAYQAARAGAYGDQSQAVIDRIKESAGADFQEAIDKGYIKPEEFKTKTVHNESGEQQQTIFDASDVDWSKLPKISKDAPKGTYLFNIGGRAGTEDMHDTLGSFYDENYGNLGVALAHSKKDLVDTYGPTIAIAMATMGIGAGLGGALGLASGSFGQAALNTGLRTGLSSLFQGTTPNPYNVGFSLLKPSFIDLIKG